MSYVWPMKCKTADRHALDFNSDRFYDFLYHHDLQAHFLSDYHTTSCILDYLYICSMDRTSDYALLPESLKKLLVVE